MAKKRMFSLDIVDTDAFLDMPQTSRLLYYELCMRADDDGFVGSPRKIQKIVGCSDDDFKVLITKKFIIPFDTGVVVITHWRIHNYIAKDRYKETLYTDEKSQLQLEENGLYTKCIQNDNNLYTQYSIDKYSIDKYSNYIPEEKISNKLLKEPKKEIILEENIKCIIDYLNASTNKHFRYNKKDTISLIKARFKDGYKLDDFYDVIDKKVKKWLKDPKMNEYLRPSTLFGNKFESYLNEEDKFSGAPKASYSSKPTFDNTINHDIGKSTLNDTEFNKLTDTEKEKYLEKLPVADMTPLQKEYFNNNCLVKDWK